MDPKAAIENALALLAELATETDRDVFGQNLETLILDLGDLQEWHRKGGFIPGAVA